MRSSQILISLYREAIENFLTHKLALQQVIKTTQSNMGTPLPSMR